jgi:hypothetical protein
MNTQGYEAVTRQLRQLVAALPAPDVPAQAPAAPAETPTTRPSTKPRKEKKVKVAE